MKKQYSQAEKIAYYERKLAEVKSPDYQDWSGRVSNEVTDLRFKSLLKEIHELRMELKALKDAYNQTIPFCLDQIEKLSIK